MFDEKSPSPPPIDPDSNPSSDIDHLHVGDPDPPIPVEATEFCRLVARILRRRISNQQPAEEKSLESVLEMTSTEYPDEDKLTEEEQHNSS